jgi:hypothetical protein
VSKSLPTAVDTGRRPRTVCPRPGVLRRWQSAPELGFGTKRHRADAAARADSMETVWTGGSTSPMLSATIVSSGGSAASSRVSAAPPRPRRKSSPAASACSLTRTSTKRVHPDSDTMLDEKLELALLRKSMSSSAGSCSPGLLPWGRRADKAGSTTLRPTVDNTLSDHGSHGERAQSRRYVFCQRTAARW